MTPETPPPTHHSRPTTRLAEGSIAAASTRHERMMAEARHIIDEGDERGVVLRLTGGLAVRFYAIDLEFAERQYSDIDLIGLKRQVSRVTELFGDLGYLENLHVAQATGNSQRQFFKPRHPLESRAHMTKRHHPLPVFTDVPPADHIDVFLDAMAMDHTLDFRDRLEINAYAVDPADIFLSKLQIFNLNEKDVHDVITLCKDVYVGEGPHPGVLDLEYVAETCADDWGLYIDVLANIDVVLERLADYDLHVNEERRVRRTLELAQHAMAEHSKSLRWRLRSRVGKRLKWYREVEETFGGRSEDTAPAVRTKEGRAARE